MYLSFFWLHLYHIWNNVRGWETWEEWKKIGTIANILNHHPESSIIFLNSILSPFLSWIYLIIRSNHLKRECVSTNHANPPFLFTSRISNRCFQSWILSDPLLDDKLAVFPLLFICQSEVGEFVSSDPMPLGSTIVQTLKQKIRDTSKVAKRGVRIQQVSELRVVMIYAKL